MTDDWNNAFSSDTWNNTLEHVRSTLNKATELETENSRLKVEKEELGAKLKRLEASYKQVVDVKNTELKWHVNHEHDAERIKELESDYDDLTADYKDLKSANEQWQMSSKHLKKERDEFEDKYLDLMDKYDELKDKYDELEQAYKQASVLTTQARQNSIQTRQNQVQQNIYTICQYVEGYWNAKIGNQGDSRKCKRVDLQWLMATVQLKEKTIRDYTKQYRKEMYQYAQQQGWKHLEFWVSNGCMFRNVSVGRVTPSPV